MNFRKKNRCPETITLPSCLKVQKLNKCPGMAFNSLVTVWKGTSCLLNGPFLIGVPHKHEVKTTTMIHDIDSCTSANSGVNPPIAKKRNTLLVRVIPKVLKITSRGAAKSKAYRCFT